ncbi:mbt repeat family protein [Aphelenchoides avenae]|nr:mbt repeat family protein [Aphelenchus avenae]
MSDAGSTPRSAKRTSRQSKTASPFEEESIDEPAADTDISDRSVSVDPTPPANYDSYRAVKHVDGLRPAPPEELRASYEWKEKLKQIREQLYSENSYKPEDVQVVPVRAFEKPPLWKFVRESVNGFKVEVEVHDYDEKFQDMDIKLYWIATVQRMVGYRMLVRWVGAEGSAHDFWVHLGSTEVHHVGYSLKNDATCKLLPPNALKHLKEDWNRYLVTQLHASKTFKQFFSDKQAQWIMHGKFSVGQRLELLDKNTSTQVRPAKVLAVVGRRIHVKVLEDDVDAKYLEGLEVEDIQVEPGVWLDQESCMIFPVGWAKRNGYNLEANKAYHAHTERIAKALEKGAVPSYLDRDAMPEQFAYYAKEAKERQWKPGYKFECLDPLNNDHTLLRVATCLEVLKDGYLKIGFDGQEMEEEAMAVHSSSPLLFPVGYAEQHGIVLDPPQETKNFDWKVYLRQSQATAAPEHLFDAPPPEGVMDMFKKGAKLEAVDLNEPNLIAPCTVVSTHGRLIRVAFDGWDDSFDTLYDYRSHDMFPLGWCDMYGHVLQYPKGSEPAPEPEAPKKKKRKSKAHY